MHNLDPSIFVDVNTQIDLNVDAYTVANPDVDTKEDFELIFLKVISVFLNFVFLKEGMGGKDCPTGRANL